MKNDLEIRALKALVKELDRECEDLAHENERLFTCYTFLIQYALANFDYDSLLKALKNSNISDEYRSNLIDAISRS